MLEQITFEFNPILAEKGLEWETAIQPDITILCDPDKIERVLDNLIRNAVNYSYPDTQIFLSMYSLGEQIEIDLKNKGKTIPPEKLSRIFEQFYRVDSSRSSRTGGAGLGLAIAKEIVTLHGGTIRATSENESICFEVILPKKLSENRMNFRRIKSFFCRKTRKYSSSCSGTIKVTKQGDFFCPESVRRI